MTWNRSLRFYLFLSSPVKFILLSCKSDLQHVSTFVIYFQAAYPLGIHRGGLSLVRRLNLNLKQIFFFFFLLQSPLMIDRLMKQSNLQTKQIQMSSPLNKKWWRPCPGCFRSVNMWWLIRSFSSESVLTSKAGVTNSAWPNTRMKSTPFPNPGAEYWTENCGLIVNDGSTLLENHVKIVTWSICVKVIYYRWVNSSTKPQKCNSWVL